MILPGVWRSAGYGSMTVSLRRGARTEAGVAAAEALRMGLKKSFLLARRQINLQINSAIIGTTARCLSFGPVTVSLVISWFILKSFWNNDVCVCDNHKFTMMFLLIAASRYKSTAVIFPLHHEKETRLTKTHQQHSGLGSNDKVFKTKQNRRLKRFQMVRSRP